jgi:hypothetical protein
MVYGRLCASCGSRRVLIISIKVQQYDETFFVAQ